ncbi:MAG: hypothetical protein H0X25_17355 [Acidobacteriales bacterium]|nr:hypothetical protein [Terriglobales bacterium]
MARAPDQLSSALYASRLRLQLCERNRAYAQRLGLVTHESYGQPPSVCYQPGEDGASHGNFLAQSYRAILRNPNWHQRLLKVHTSQRTALPRHDRRWRELDTCTSSDALLMNIFCYPGLRRDGRLLKQLGVDPSSLAEFGVRVKVPLAGGRGDGTEADMRLGDLLVEAKLTESDFQSREAATLAHYRDFEHAFDLALLPRSGDRLLGYQLIRNVLAAYASGESFCLMCDARRPDLQELWYRVMRAVVPAELRVRCKLFTWQEIASVVPLPLLQFLQDKYGISE